MLAYSPAKCKFIILKNASERIKKPYEASDAAGSCISPGFPFGKRAVQALEPGNEVARIPTLNALRPLTMRIYSQMDRNLHLK